MRPPVTPFQAELDQIRPSFTSTPIDHPNFAFPWNYFKEFARTSNGGDIILIVGPSNSGKSQLLSMIAKHLRESVFPEVESGSVPIIGASAQTSSDSRMTPKHLVETLLADGGHLMFDAEKQVRMGFYTPSQRITEAKLLRLLSGMLVSCNVRYVLIDEGQFITRTKDKLFAATLVESLKTLAGPQRNLVICGGYELLEPVLAYRAHVAARTVVLHLAPYQLPTGSRAWAAILKAMTVNGTLGCSEHVLRAFANELLDECNGCIGVLERRLRDASAWAAACGAVLDESVLRARRPNRMKWEAERNDIDVGLANLGLVEWSSGDDGRPVLVSSGLERHGKFKSSSSKKERTSRSTRPFERKPNRFPGNFE